MALRMKKNSAFLAYQLAGSDSENSADERREEQKEKQKAKKKSRTKKKNSDSAVLKDLAMCAISKPKKSKGKATKSTTPPPEPADEAPVPVPVPAAAAPVVVEEKASVSAPAPVPAAKQPQPKAAAPVSKQMELKPKPSAAATKTNAKATPGPQHAAKPQETSAPPPPAAPNGVAAPKQQQQQQQNDTDLGAIYSPTHVKITRADGQMTRTIAVSEMMDQLYLFGNQNAQLRIVQEQLTVANRSMQEQLQRDAEIINGLQNEVTMFRQMCLNLQAEVSMHRSAAGTTKPSQPVAHRPPPGM